MSGRTRAFGRRAAAFLLTLITLCGQSVLPVSADTVDTEQESAAEGYTVAEDGAMETMEYFDRIAVSSLKGNLTIRSGEDFGISFQNQPEVPQYYVQDGILVVTGKKDSAGEESGSSDGGANAGESGVVVIGEDEPGESGSGTAGEAAGESAEENVTDDTLPEQETGSGEAAEEALKPQTVITIPSGIGLNTLRVAIVDGALVITDITATNVTIQSTGGDVIMKNVSFGTVDIYASSGDVQFSEGSFNSLSIGVGSGNVTVKSDEGLARCRMELKTEDGTVTVNGAVKGSQYLQPGAGKRFLNIQDEEGDISVTG